MNKSISGGYTQRKEEENEGEELTGEDGDDHRPTKSRRAAPTAKASSGSKVKCIYVACGYERERERVCV